MPFEAEQINPHKEPSIEERVEALWHHFRGSGPISEDMLSEILRQMDSQYSNSNEIQETHDIPEDSDSQAYLPAQYHRIILEAERRAQRILDQARLDAQKEVSELRRQAIEEIRSVIASIEDLRTALMEETEAQRVLSHVERLKSATLWLKEDMGLEEVDHNLFADIDHPF